MSTIDNGALEGSLGQQDFENWVNSALALTRYAYRYKPEHQHGALRAHAGVLHRFGVIDNDELLELNDLADARYAHVAEKLLAGLDEDI